MISEHRKNHWEKIYSTKRPEELSWYEEVPQISLTLIAETGMPETSEIFDNGAGESRLAENLLMLGYKNLTVRDISENALNITKSRLGEKSQQIDWIIGDEATCCLNKKFDIWHDRAAFHFLTAKDEIENYIKILESCIKPGGYFIVAVFSDKGPLKCSGLEVSRYSEHELEDLLKCEFQKIHCFTTDHHTPAGKPQNFLYCVFRKKLN